MNGASVCPTRTCGGGCCVIASADGAAATVMSPEVTVSSLPPTVAEARRRYTPSVSIDAAPKVASPDCGACGPPPERTAVVSGCPAASRRVNVTAFVEPGMTFPRSSVRRTTGAGVSVPPTTPTCGLVANSSAATVVPRILNRGRSRKFGSNERSEVTRRRYSPGTAPVIAQLPRVATPWSNAAVKSDARAAPTGMLKAESVTLPVAVVTVLPYRSTAATRMVPKAVPVRSP